MKKTPAATVNEKVLALVYFFTSFKSKGSTFRVHLQIKRNGKEEKKYEAINLETTNLDDIRLVLEDAIKKLTLMF